MALVLQFLMFPLVPHVGPTEGVRNVIKPLPFYNFEHKGLPSNGRRKAFLAKYVRKNNGLRHLGGMLLGDLSGQI